MDSTIEKIINQKILPLFYHDSFEVSYQIIAALYKGGIRVIEYTNRGEKALENFRKLKEVSLKEFPELLLGIGTIRNTTEMDAYISASCDFLISPIVNQELLQHASEREMLLIPGCLTPSEVNMAYQKGLKLVKIFPVDAVSRNYLKSIGAVFPGMHFMPTGGVKAETDDIEQWLKYGASAVGLGSSLISNNVDLGELTSQVKELLSKLNS